MTQKVHVVPALRITDPILEPTILHILPAGNPEQLLLVFQESAEVVTTEIADKQRVYDLLGEAKADHAFNLLYSVQPTSSYVQVFNDNGNHWLHNLATGAKSKIVSYTKFSYLEGKVGVTDYYTGTGEQITDPFNFCQQVSDTVGIDHND